MFLTFNVQKIKTMDGVRAASNHNLRLGNFGKNVDSELTKDNLTYSIGDATPYDSIKRLWKEVGEQREQLGVRKLRDDTNKAVEVIVGASAEFFEDKTPAQIKEFFIDQLNWLNKEYAGKGEMVSAVVHMDEPGAAPHMQAIFAPIQNRPHKINSTDHVNSPTFSADYMVGNRGDLIATRTSQAKALGEKWGLERGEQYDVSTDPEKRRRDRQSLKEFKAEQARLDKETLEMLKEFDVDTLKTMATDIASKQKVYKKLDGLTADDLANFIVKNYRKTPRL